MKKTIWICEEFLNFESVKNFLIKNEIGLFIQNNSLAYDVYTDKTSINLFNNIELLPFENSIHDIGVGVESDKWCYKNLPELKTKYIGIESQEWSKYDVINKAKKFGCNLLIDTNRIWKLEVWKMRVNCEFTYSRYRDIFWFLFDMFGIEIEKPFSVPNNVYSYMKKNYGTKFYWISSESNNSQKQIEEIVKFVIENNMHLLIYAKETVSFLDFSEFIKKVISAEKKFTKVNA